MLSFNIIGKHQSGLELRGVRAGLGAVPMGEFTAGGEFLLGEAVRGNGLPRF